MKQENIDPRFVATYWQRDRHGKCRTKTKLLSLSKNSKNNTSQIITDIFNEQ
jgi:hypothetical protein